MAEDGYLESLEEVWTIDYNDIEIEEEIGKGNFGKVYKGTYFGTPVAVKKLAEGSDDEGLKFVRRELQVLKGIRHPNIVQFIGMATTIDGIYIITEFAANGDLRRILKDTSKELPWLQRMRFAFDAACAMAYLHSRNIIHRDLKSKNFLVDENNRIKVADFGFARVKAGSDTSRMTLCGTDDWMAPEVILGIDYNDKADVFSYGIVLCEIITRAKVGLEMQRSPADAFGLNVEKFLQLIPPDCPPAFRQLAIDCCAYYPKDRPAFKEIVRSLDGMIKAAQQSAPSPPPASTSSSTPPTMAVSTPSPAAASTPSIPATKQASPVVKAPVMVGPGSGIKPVVIPRSSSGSPASAAPAPMATKVPVPPAMPQRGAMVARESPLGDRKDWRKGLKLGSLNNNL